MLRSLILALIMGFFLLSADIPTMAASDMAAPVLVYVKVLDIRTGVVVGGTEVAAKCMGKEWALSTHALTRVDGFTELEVKRLGEVTYCSVFVMPRWDWQMRAYSAVGGPSLYHVLVWVGP